MALPCKGMQTERTPFKGLMSRLSLGLLSNDAFVTGFVTVLAKHLETGKRQTISEWGTCFLSL